MKPKKLFFGNKIVYHQSSVIFFDINEDCSFGRNIMSYKHVAITGPPGNIINCHALITRNIDSRSFINHEKCMILVDSYVFLEYLVVLFITKTCRLHKLLINMYLNNFLHLSLLTFSFVVVFL